MMEKIFLYALVIFALISCSGEHKKTKEVYRADAGIEGVKERDPSGTESEHEPTGTHVEWREELIRTESDDLPELIPDDRKEECRNLRKTWEGLVKKYNHCEKDGDCILMGHDVNGGDCGGCFFSISLTGESVNKKAQAELSKLIENFNNRCKQYPLCGTDLYISEDPRCSSKGICISTTKTCFDLRD